MNHFKQLPEFEKELKKLLKKYRSLNEDLEKFKNVIFTNPTGLGNNFDIIHNEEKVQIIKARLSCKSLKDRSMRIIYAYHNNVFDFVFIEIYFKGNKVNEDRDRIKQYLKTML